MKPLIATLALFALLGAMPSPDATPTPSPWVYNDTAMHFEAPHDYILAGIRQVDSKNLPDGQTTVAVWAKHPGQDDQRTISIKLERYDGTTLDGFETNTENTLRSQIDGVFIGNKEHITLTNGMPAIFMSIASGSGFGAQKIFQVIWFDGLRGVSIQMVGALGSLQAPEAKAALRNASAVLYPIHRL